MDELSISEAARATGLSAHTIRYYERRGLLAAPHRSANGYRVYREPDIRRLRLAARLRAIGTALPDIERVAAAAFDGDCGQHAARMVDLIDRQRSRVREKMAELERLAADLDALREEVTAVVPAAGLRVDECPCCPMIDDGSAGAAYCSPAYGGPGIDVEILDVLQCDIGSRPVDAPGFDVLAPALHAVHRGADSVRLVFDRTAADDVAAFAAAERVCCSGIGWDVRATGEGTELEVRGTPAQVEAMAVVWEAAL